MPVCVKIPTPLQKFVESKSEVYVEGKNVEEVLKYLEDRYPGIKGRLYDDQGQLRRFVNFFINKDDIRTLQGAQTPVKDGDEISIIPAIAGGK